MIVKMPSWLRVTIYVTNGLGAPLVAYALAKGWIGQLEVTLWSGEVAAAFVLAGLNVTTTPTDVDDGGGRHAAE